MRIGTILAGAIGTIDIPWLPALITMAPLLAADMPSAFKVTMLGDGVISDLDEAGIEIINRAMKVGNTVKTAVPKYTIPCSDGIVRGQNCSIIIDNSGSATDLPVYGTSDQIGTTYIRSLQQKIFAKSGIQLASFLEAMFPEFVEADEMNITYQSGFNQKFAPDDLIAANAFNTFVDVAAPDEDYRIQNSNGQVSQVSYIPAADQFVYILKYQAIGNL